MKNLLKTTFVLLILFTYSCSKEDQQIESIAKDSLTLFEESFKTTHVNQSKAINKFVDRLPKNRNYNKTYADIRFDQVKLILEKTKIDFNYNLNTIFGVYLYSSTNKNAEVSDVKAISIVSLENGYFYLNHFENNKNTFIEKKEMYSAAKKLIYNYFDIIHLNLFPNQNNTKLYFLSNIDYDFSTTHHQGSKHPDVKLNHISNMDAMIVEKYPNIEEIVAGRYSNYCTACQSPNSKGNCEIWDNGTISCEKHPYDLADDSGKNVTSSDYMGQSLADIFRDREDFAYRLRDEFFTKSNLGRKYIEKYYGLNVLNDVYKIPVSFEDKVEAYHIAFNIFGKLYNKHSNNTTVVITNQQYDRIHYLYTKYRTAIKHPSYTRIMDQIFSDVVTFKNKTKIQILNEIKHLF